MAPSGGKARRGAWSIGGRCRPGGGSGAGAQAGRHWCTISVPRGGAGSSTGSGARRWNALEQQRRGQIPSEGAGHRGAVGPARSRRRPHVPRPSQAPRHRGGHRRCRSSRRCARARPPVRGAPVPPGCGPPARPPRPRTPGARVGLPPLALAPIQRARRAALGQACVEGHQVFQRHPEAAQGDRQSRRATGQFRGHAGAAQGGQDAGGAKRLGQRHHRQVQRQLQRLSHRDRATEGAVEVDRPVAGEIRRHIVDQRLGMRRGPASKAMA